ncbi:chorismate mutase / prephenate dehydratase [Planctomycetaceae bacterium]|nr:chorismate mutase / prephenate dehydratase [Planctomycetaceae bacterium]
MRIAFAGERGSYAEAAAARMFANEDIATVAMRNYRAAFDALASGDVDYTVVPLENSFSGPNTPLFDHLRERRCYISRESRITEIYNLAGQKGARLQDIRRIHAHPVPLALCQDFLERLEGVEIVTRFDSASAFTQLQKAGKHEATVCSDYAASIYGLNIIQRGIQSEADSVTRFVAIGRELEMPPADADDPRTMILFELKHVAGALLSVLEVMKKYNISVHQMGARPNRVNKFEYMIALEFPGRANDKSVTAALKELKTRTTYLQLLGSYDKVEMGTSSGRFKAFRPGR